MIPKIIHFIWLGPMLDWVADNIRRFETLNPEHKISLHRDADELNPAYLEAYGHCVNISAQSDLLRLSILERHGGWYFDTDTFALRPVADIELAYDIGDRLFAPACGGVADIDVPIIATSKTCVIWPFVHEFIASAELPQKDFWHFANTMMTRINREHPGVIELGKPDDFHIRGEPNIHTYLRLLAGETVRTKAFCIHGFVGVGTSNKPVKMPGLLT